MSAAALSSTSAQPQGATYPTVIAPQQSEPPCNPLASLPVGAVAHGTLSDEDREAAIQRAGAAMQKHYADWNENSCFASLGSAHHARILMEKLIAGRSSAQVAKMERERGLA